MKSPGGLPGLFYFSKLKANKLKYHGSILKL
jgi:hypothetical protein